MTFLSYLINRVMFWTAATLIALDAYYIIFHKGIPTLRTAPAIRRAIIARFLADKAARGLAHYTVFDLGSGTGLITREIARAMPDAQVVGLEVTRQSVIWSNWMKRAARLNNLEYRRMNFFDHDLAGADAVVMYLLPPIMGLVGKKLHQEARPGTLIISNKFALGDGWQAEAELDIKTRYPHQGKVFVYRKA